MLDGEKPANAVHHITIDILNSEIVQDRKTFSIRDPDGFVSGAINNSSDEWLKHFGEDLPIQIKDILTDNKSVIVVWENRGGRDKLFNDFMKDLFKHMCENNIDFRLQYIPSSLNDADAISRSVSLVDSKLSVESWSRVESTYGPHTVDLMSLDSNALTTTSSKKLKQFTLAPSPFSASVDIFAKDVSLETNSYVYPPINIIFQLLAFRKEQRASGTVENLTSYLTGIFESLGRGRTWNTALNADNHAASETIKAYLKAVQEEQAIAHIVPKQVKPIFINKVRSITVYVSRELKRYDLTLRERFVLQRDQAAFLKLQFFLLQGVKKLNDDSGLVFNHTFGKTLRGGSNNCNTIVLKRCDEKIVCPVSGFESYYMFMKNHEFP
ncbi:unnamed protein product [Mytilus coruscus]|uniref:Uncharacterized protein n=1 Tax=Mytilus coruscus TaxID=42192 RepID=A0A6J8A1E7_MYTCO|nr:unnamed protein product [Mytilus coruscus]